MEICRSAAAGRREVNGDRVCGRKRNTANSYATRTRSEADHFDTTAARVRNIGITQALYSRLFLVSLTLTAALATAFAYGFGGVEGPATQEHRQPSKQLLLLGREQIVAPVDRRPKRLVPRRAVLL